MRFDDLMVYFQIRTSAYAEVRRPGTRSSDADPFPETLLKDCGLARPPRPPLNVVRVWLVTSRKCRLMDPSIKCPSHRERERERERERGRGRGRGGGGERERGKKGERRVGGERGRVGEGGSKGERERERIKKTQCVSLTVS